MARLTRRIAGSVNPGSSNQLKTPPRMAHINRVVFNICRGSVGSVLAFSHSFALRRMYIKIPRIPRSPKSPNQYKPSNQIKGMKGFPHQVCGEGPDEGPIVVAGKRELSEDASISEKLDEGEDDAMEDFFGLDD